VFGSCAYRRFSPSLLDSLQSIEGAEHDPSLLAPKLTEIVQSEWDYSVSPARLPPRLRLVLGDVEGGSSTPGMVRHLLHWRKERGEEANAIWEAIDEQNEGLFNMLADLTVTANERQDHYDNAMSTLAATSGHFTAMQGSRNVVIQILRQLKNKLISIRKGVREMGEAAGIPIEPPSQRRLLDYLSHDCPGVIGGVVPGAGGYDAIALLVADHEDVVKGVKEKLEGYQFEGEAGSGGSRVEVLEARDEHEGLRAEDTSQY